MKKIKANNKPKIIDYDFFAKFYNAFMDERSKVVEKVTKFIKKI